MVSEVASYVSVKKVSYLDVGTFYNITHTQRNTPHLQELEYLFKQKDLGVILHAELKYDEHISEKLLVGLIQRSFRYFGGPLSRKLFTTFVRPHLVYGQGVWAPYLKKYVSILGNVQSRAAKLVDGFCCLSYSERLGKLNLPSVV